MPELRGFALLSKAQRIQMATKGGVAAQRQKKAHRWTKREAAEAGRRSQRNQARRRAARSVAPPTEPSAREQHRAAAEEIRRARVS